MRISTLLLFACTAATARDGDVSLPAPAPAKAKRLLEAADRVLEEPGTDDRGVEVRVDARGRLLLPATINGEPGWAPSSWRSVRAWLGARAARAPRDADRLPRLDVVVAADGAAPWQHVQWVLLAAAEAGCGRIRIALRAPAGAGEDGAGDEPDVRHLRLRLPPPVRTAHPTNEVVFRVRLRVLVRTVDGDGRPRRIAFRFAGEESGSARDVVGWVADARRAATGHRGARLRAVPHIDPMAPHADAVRGLVALRVAGLREFAFLGTSVPEKLRDAERLPPPKDNRLPEATWGRFFAGAGLVPEKVVVTETPEVEASAAEEGAKENGADEGGKKKGGVEAAAEDGPEPPPDR